MIKVLVLLTLCSLIIFIAYKIFDYYKERQKFFQNASDFCSYMINEIGFLKTDINSLVEKYKNHSQGDFSKMLNLYQRVLNKTDNFYDDYLKALNKLNILNSEEKEKFCSFFSNLGKSSQSEELANIENFKTDLSNALLKAKEDNIKFGSLYIKLGILLSVAVFIIFI